MAISFAKLHFAEPSPVARRSLWHVLSVSIASRDEPERHEGFDKPGAFLFWTASGHGSLELEGRSFSLAPGPCCWLLDLSEPRLSVKDVARQLNFSSEFYFSHFFRESIGLSPSQFRVKSRT